MSSSTTLSTETAAILRLQAFVRGYLARKRVSEHIVQLIEELRVIMRHENVEQPQPLGVVSEEGGLGSGITLVITSPLQRSSSLRTSSSTRHPAVFTSLDERLHQYVEAAASPQAGPRRQLSIQPDPLADKVAHYLQETQSPQRYAEASLITQNAVAHEESGAPSPTSNHISTTPMAALKARFSTADTMIAPTLQTGVTKHDGSPGKITTNGSPSNNRNSNNIRSVAPFPKLHKASSNDYHNHKNPSTNVDSEQSPRKARIGSLPKLQPASPKPWNQKPLQYSPRSFGTVVNIGNTRPAAAAYVDIGNTGPAAVNIATTSVDNGIASGDRGDELQFDHEYARSKASTRIAALVRGHLARTHVLKTSTSRGKKPRRPSISELKQVFLHASHKGSNHQSEPETTTTSHSASGRQMRAAARLKARQTKIQQAAIKIQAIVRGFLVRGMDFEEALIVMEKLEFFRTSGSSTIPGPDEERVMATINTDASELRQSASDDVMAITLTEETLPEPTEEDLENAWTVAQKMKEGATVDDKTGKPSPSFAQILSTWDWIKTSREASHAESASNRPLLDGQAPHTGDLIAFSGWLVETGLADSVPGIVVESSPSSSVIKRPRLGVSDGQSITSTAKSDNPDDFSSDAVDSPQFSIPSVPRTLASKLNALSTHGDDMTGDQRREIAEAITELIQAGNLNFDEVFELWSFLEFHDFDMSQFKRRAVDTGITNPVVSEALYIKKMAEMEQYIDEDHSHVYQTTIRMGHADASRSITSQDKYNKLSPECSDETQVTGTAADYSSIYTRKSEAGTGKYNEKESKPQISYIDEDFSGVYANSAGDRPSMEDMVNYYGFTKRCADLPQSADYDVPDMQKAPESRKEISSDEFVYPRGSERQSDKMLSTLKWLERQGIQVDKSSKQGDDEHESPSSFAIELDVDEVPPEHNIVTKEDLSTTIEWLTSRGFTMKKLDTKEMTMLEAGGVRTSIDLDVTGNDQLGARLEIVEKEIEYNIKKGESQGAPSVNGLTAGLLWLQHQAKQNRDSKVRGTNQGNTTELHDAPLVDDDDDDSTIATTRYDSTVLHSLSWLQKHGLDLDGSVDAKPSNPKDGSSLLGQAPKVESLVNVLTEINDHDQGMTAKQAPSPSAKAPKATKKAGPKKPPVKDMDIALKWLAARGIGQNLLKSKQKQDLQAKTVLAIGDLKILPDLEIDESSDDEIDVQHEKESGAMKWLKKKGFAVKTRRQPDHDVPRKIEGEVSESQPEHSTPSEDRVAKSENQDSFVSGDYNDDSLASITSDARLADMYVPSTKKKTRSKSTNPKSKAKASDHQQPENSTSSEGRAATTSTQGGHQNSEYNDSFASITSDSRLAEANVPSTKKKTRSRSSNPKSKSFRDKISDRQQPENSTSSEGRAATTSTQGAHQNSEYNDSFASITSDSRLADAYVPSTKKKTRSRSSNPKSKSFRDEISDHQQPANSTSSEVRAAITSPTSEAETSKADKNDPFVSITSDAPLNDNHGPSTKKHTRSRSRNPKSRSQKESQESPPKKKEEMNKSLAWLQAKSQRSPKSPNQVLRAAAARRSSNISGSLSVIPAFPDLDSQHDQRKSKAEAPGLLEDDPKPQTDPDFDRAMEWLNNKSAELEDATYFKRLDNMLPRKASQTQAERAREMVKALHFVKKQGLLNKGGTKKPEAIISAVEIKSPPRLASSMEDATPSMSKISKSNIVSPPSPASGSPSRNKVSLKVLKANAVAREKMPRSPKNVSPSAKVGSLSTNPETRDYENAMLFLAAFEKGGNEWERVDDSEHFKNLNNMIPNKAGQSIEERAQKMCKMLGFLKKKGKV